MKRPYYLFSNGRLKRKHNTLSLQRAEESVLADDHPDNEGLPSVSPEGNRNAGRPHTFPIESVESLYLFGEIDINTKLVTFLAQQSVPVFFFDYYGHFTATLYPREAQLSGRLHVSQVQHYLSRKKRLLLAQSFIEAALFNIERVVKYYSGRIEDNTALLLALEDMAQARSQLSACTDIPVLMSVEGRMRDRYYQLWPHFLEEAVTAQFPFNKRERRPPSNELNALISFGNSLCYSAVLKQIYRTALDPTIAYLHEPGERRFSLALDLSEIFKPMLVDRAIFRLLKTGAITPKHFEKRLGGCYLSESGRRVFVEHWDKRLSKTVQHRGLGKKVSYERLIRLECYKLVRHLCDAKADPYQGFHMWW